MLISLYQVLAGSKSVTELFLDDNEITEEGVKELVSVVYSIGFF